MIHYLKGHKGKIYDFAAVEAKRCDKITYHIAELLKDNELCDDVLGSAEPTQSRTRPEDSAVNLCKNCTSWIKALPNSGRWRHRRLV